MTAPWTLHQFLAELRRAGWRRVEDADGRTYVSPDDPSVLFRADSYRYGIGVLWEYFATRRELPATTRPPF